MAILFVVSESKDDATTAAKHKMLRTSLIRMSMPDASQAWTTNASNSPQKLLEELLKRCQNLKRSVEL